MTVFILNYLTERKSTTTAHDLVLYLSVENRKEIIAEWIDKQVSNPCF